jgi:hypothetical protein
MPNPWDNDPIIGWAQQGTTAADALGRPIITKGVSPTETVRPMTPAEKTQYGIPADTPATITGAGKPDIINTGGGDKTSYTPMSHDAKVAAGLDPSLPFYIGSNGLPTLPSGAKGSAGPVDLPTAQAHISDVLSQIDKAKTLLGNPLSTGLPGSVLGHVPGTDAYTLRSLIGDPSDPNNPGQISGDLRQQGIAYLRALNGGNGVGTVARSQQEQAALQSAMSNLRQGLPAADLAKSLDDVGQIYRRAYAQSFGLDPTNPAVQKQFGINPLWVPPGGLPQKAQPAAQSPGAPAPNATGQYITPSNPLPALKIPDPEGVSQGDTKVQVNPELEKYGPQIAAYLNAPIKGPGAVSNAQILGFMQKNGIDPASTNIMPLLQMRATGKYSGFTVDPRVNVPLQGMEKVRAEISASPAAAAVMGAGDTATMGLAPDVLGSLPGLTRTDVIKARDATAANNPGATIAGNLLGGLVALPASGEASALGQIVKNAGQGALYGFAGSDDPDIRARLVGAAEGGLLGGIGGAVGQAAMGGAQGGYRAAANQVNKLASGSEAAADQAALQAAARKMPVQNMGDVQAADAAAKAAGVPQPAAVSINRAGQDYLARAAAGSPAARQVADSAAQSLKQNIPQQLAGDFNAAIEAVAPRGVDSSAYLNRPVRDIASDIQSMAGREYERGIAPIASNQLQLTPELTGDLEHERVAGAIKDALANNSLSDETRTELRNLIPQIKTLSTAPDIAKQAYANGIGLSVDSARNIATSLDRTAGKLQDGTEGQVELSRLSRDIRGAIAEQYPEYSPVNDLYASRMRAKEAAFAGRSNFFASTPEQADSLAVASRNFTPEANPPEKGARPQVAENGFVKPVQPLPSNQQLAMAGAREAAQVKAGENGSATAQRIASNPNQQGNNATVLGDQAAPLQAKAAVRANVADVTNNIASGATGDQTAKWFNMVKQAAALKLTGHGGNFMLAHAASSVPGLSSQDAARVVRLYLDSDSAPQVLQSLTQAYGQRRARFIMGRMAAVTSAASGVRGFSGDGQ